MKQTNAATLLLAIAIFFNSPAAYAGIFDGDQRRSIVDNNDPRIDALSDAVGAASEARSRSRRQLLMLSGYRNEARNSPHSSSRVKRTADSSCGQRAVLSSLQKCAAGSERANPQMAAGRYSHQSHIR
jgi:hypothetical protein